MKPWKTQSDVDLDRASWMGQAEDSLLQAGKTESQIRILVRQNSKPQDLIVYAYGSVNKDLSGWGYTIKQGVIIIHEDNSVNHSLFLNQYSSS